MAGTDRDDTALAALFAAARAETPAPGSDLMARVLADALEAQAGFAPGRGGIPVPLSSPVPAQSRWRQLVAALGGWPALGGLAMAGLAGLWIGVSPPQALVGLPLTGVSGAAADLTDFFPVDGLDFAGFEEG